jgi:hypothetical protein
VRAVDRVARLEADDRLPAAARELRARLRGREPVLDEVVVRRELDHPDGPRQAVVAGVVERPHPGVLEVLGAEHRLRLGRSVALVRLGELEQRERRRTVCRGQRDRLRAADPLHVVLVRRQRDRDRPRQAVREVHRVEDRSVLALAHEARERRQRADGEHLEIGELALVHHELRMIHRVLAGRVALGLRDEEVHQRAAVRRAEGSDRLPVRTVGGHASPFAGEGMM